MPGVLALLKSKDARDLQTGAELTAKLGHGAAAAVPSLIELLSHQNEKVRDASISALAELGPTATNAVQPLLALLLRDKSAKAERAIAYALGEIGPQASGAVPALIELLESSSDHEGFVNVNAADALGKIGPAAAAAVPALIAALKSDDPRLPTAAASALGEIGAGAQSAIPALIEAMRVEEKEHRTNQAEALGKIAQGLELKGEVAALPALRTALLAVEEEGVDPRAISPLRDALDSLARKDAATNH
jgi:HEAT repeat protein